MACIRMRRHILKLGVALVEVVEGILGFLGVAGVIRVCAGVRIGGVRDDTGVYHLSEVKDSRRTSEILVMS